MKIIELPNKNEEKPIYHIRCANPRCEALIEVEHSELKFVDFAAFNVFFYIMKCPNCSVGTNLYQSELNKCQKR